MIRILEDLAYDAAKRATFQQDPEAFVEQYAELTQYEKYLLVERDAAAIEGYLRNGPAPVGEGAIYAAATVVAVQAIIVVALRVPHEEPALAATKRFNAYWDRVRDRAEAIAS